MKVNALGIGICFRPEEVALCLALQFTPTGFLLLTPARVSAVA